MPDGRPYNDTEAKQMQVFRETAQTVSRMPDIPRPIQAALAHVLSAAVTEMANGRPLPLELRRAAKHVHQAITEVQQGLGTPGRKPG